MQSAKIHEIDERHAIGNKDARSLLHGERHPLIITKFSSILLRIVSFFFSGIKRKSGLGTL